MSCAPSPSIQPAASEDIESAADKKSKRTLASKLMNRSKRGLGGGSGGKADGSTSSLDRLAFGGHQLSRESTRLG